MNSINGCYEEKAVVTIQAYTGSNLTDIKAQNRNLILKLICTLPDVSRADLARMTGLTKTTLGNIVSELTEQNIICEKEESPKHKGKLPGRKPILLDISPESPCIIGVLIKRGLNTIVLADLKGQIIEQIDRFYEGPISAETLIGSLISLYREIMSGTSRKIIAVGIASIGPVNTASQRIVNPPNFFGIQDLPITDIIEKKTGLPAFLINDSDAGALAEKLYGNAKSLDNFIYLHIMNGIGAGYILDGKPYNGNYGKSGEIGHTSINFSGPLCDCGNTGCLELYANLQNMNKRIEELKKIYGKPSVLPLERTSYTWREMIDAAEAMDYYSTIALEEFCEYLSYALTTVVNLLDIDTVIVGYEGSPSANRLENILQSKLNSKALGSKTDNFTVQKSLFNSNAPLIGSIAAVTNKIFSGEVSLF